MAIVMRLRLVAAPSRQVFGVHLRSFSVCAPAAGPDAGDVAPPPPDAAKPTTAAAAPLYLGGLSHAELRELVVKAGVPAYRGDQVWNWMHVQGAQAFDDMRTLPAALRTALAHNHTVAAATIAKDQLSEDGTRKWLMRLYDGTTIETVFIPEAERGTLCVSSQAGCSLSCKFCFTGTQKLKRNLSAAEIVEQVRIARRLVGDLPLKAINAPRAITNIVFMGQGEPLYNYRNVKKAIELISDPSGLAIPQRRITVSTSGVVPNMTKMVQELDVRMAVSLHAPNNTLRNILMNVNRTYPLPMLMDACKECLDINRKKGQSRVARITFEYVLLAGVNDSPSHARELVELLQPIPCHVNLIPFNPWPGAPFKRPTDAAVKAFVNVLQEAEVVNTVRKQRGDDILAACGQLQSQLT